LLEQPCKFYNFRMLPETFWYILNYIFRSIWKVHVPGVDSAFRNEYQDIPGGKDGRCVGLTLPP
jgi:hypothetical protein